jgi:ribosomal protein S18 acetylase RimI-like enzyme
MSVDTTPSIRPGAPADAAPLARLGARAFADAFGAENSPEDMAAYLGRSYGEAQQAAELSDPGMATLLAELHGELAGFAQLRSGPAPVCVTGLAPIELWRFYVDRPWHGRGVAQALMAAVAREAARRGGRTLWLAVWERNDRALAFYRKCGFLDVGSQPFILGSDRQTDRVMLRSLEPMIPTPRS